MLLDKALTLVIPSSYIRDMDRSDLDKLLESYSLVDQAKDSMLQGEITPDEYLQLVELHGANVDSYADSIEHNLHHFGLA